MSRAIVTVMSNLIPTPIVDKNGKPTLVHKKPTAEGVPPRTAMPHPVVSSQAPMSPQSRLYADTLALIYSDDPSEQPMEAESLIFLLDSANNETLPLLQRLLSTGVPEAQVNVRQAVQESLNDIGDAQRQGQRLADGEDYLQNVYGSFIQHGLAGDALRIWNAFNVRDETGSDISMESLFMTIGELESSYTEMDPVFTEYPKDEWYWRGVTAVAMSRYREGEQVTANRDDIKEFIEWSGKHEDITRVIEMASERGTIHTETIRSLMELQDPSSPVREGIL